MSFNFINSSIVTKTNFSYEDFDKIVSQFGYKIEMNGYLHNYFKWDEIECWVFDYEIYSENELASFFTNSLPFLADSSFLVRLNSDQSLIEIKAIDIKYMFEDLCYETGMGWEAISTDGKFIFEFTDGYEHLTKSNFKIV